MYPHRPPSGRSIGPPLMALRYAGRRFSNMLAPTICRLCEKLPGRP